MNKIKVEYQPIIGIEVHIELKTKSKMFCGCKNDPFHAPKPNCYTCPTCLGLPGALPVPNKKAIEWCRLIGLALGCKLNEISKFDRKNYFYPDLAKGYQISQYDQPFARDGELKIKAVWQSQISLCETTKSLKVKTIRINRVHMEEDTAKLIHQFGNQNDKFTYIDFNRSGVPLVEIVTEPDINSSDEAVIYLKKIQQIIRYLEVSDCDMEKGSMRCEVNISLRSKQKTVNSNEELPKYKVEVKNINSFRFVKKAIEYEIRRQARLLDHQETPIQETRGFNSAKGITFSQRTKEEAHDYRYFPEPDIPPVKFSILNFQFLNNITELPDQKIERFIRQYGLTEYNANILCQEKKTADYFEEAVLGLQDDKMIVSSQKEKIKLIANLIVNKKVDINKLTPKQLLDFQEQQKTNLVTDQGRLNEIADKVIKNNAKAVSDYKAGKQEVIGFLIGQVMRETGGKAEAGMVRKLLLNKLT